MGRPRVSDERKHQIHVCVYMNELEKEEFTNKIASDPQNRGLGMSKVVNKLIRGYINDCKDNSISVEYGNSLTAQELTLLKSIISDDVKKDTLFKYIHDSKTLS